MCDTQITNNTGYKAYHVYTYNVGLNTGLINIICATNVNSRVLVTWNSTNVINSTTFTGLYENSFTKTLNEPTTVVVQVTTDTIGGSFQLEVSCPTIPPTPSNTPTSTVTPTNTITPTRTPTITPTNTRTPTVTPTTVFCYARTFYASNVSYTSSCPKTGTTFTAWVRRSTGRLLVTDRIYYDYYFEDNGENLCKNNAKDTPTNESCQILGALSDPETLSISDDFGSYTYNCGPSYNYYITVVDSVACSVIPTPSPTPSNPATPSVTPTRTITSTSTITPTTTLTPTSTITPTNTITNTPSSTPLAACKTFLVGRDNTLLNNCGSACSVNNNSVQGRYATFNSANGAVYYPTRFSCENSDPTAWGVERIFAKDGFCYGFNSSGAITGNTICPISVSVNLVGGGGGGGAGSSGGAGGAGAGGDIVIGNLNVNLNETYGITIGSGGFGGVSSYNGGQGGGGIGTILSYNATNLLITNNVGGGGASETNKNGFNGGGGGSLTSTPIGIGSVAPYGYSGANGQTTRGGGGAGFGGSASGEIPGDGGTLPLTICSKCYSAGGIGGDESSSVEPSNSPNLGRGGNGGNGGSVPSYNGSSGSSGVAFIQVPAGYKITGSNVSQVGSTTTYKITATTSITFTTV